MVSDKYRTRTKGLSNLIKKLRDAKDAHARGFEHGLVVAGNKVLSASNDLVPIEFADLINSGQVVQKGHGFKTVVKVEYTDPKAIYVHEDMSKSHGFRFNINHAAEIAAGLEFARRPQEQAKFLETAFRRGEKMILKTISESMVSYRKNGWA